MSVAIQGPPLLENMLLGPAPKVITVRVEPIAKRVRAFVGGVAIADSCRVMMMFETARLCVYYFPVDDVRTDLLVITSKVVRSLRSRGGRGSSSRPACQSATTSQRRMSGPIYFSGRLRRPHAPTKARRV